MDWVGVFEGGFGGLGVEVLEVEVWTEGIEIPALGGGEWGW